MARDSDPSPDAKIAMSEEVARGIASADSGRLLPYETVRRWILSWGSDSELDPPQCK